MGAQASACGKTPNARFHSHRLAPEVPETAPPPMTFFCCEQGSLPLFRTRMVLWARNSRGETSPGNPTRILGRLAGLQPDCPSASRGRAAFRLGSRARARIESAANDHCAQRSKPRPDRGFVAASARAGCVGPTGWAARERGGKTLGRAHFSGCRGTQRSKPSC